MYKNKKILALIPARGGSKGLPGKNIKPLLKKPLVAWTIEQALESIYLDKVMVNTDDEKIARISKKYGAEVPFLRPKELAGDESKIADTILHTLDVFKKDGLIFDYVALLEPTSPLRKEGDIDNAIKKLIDCCDKADSIISVGEIALEHPAYFKKIDNKNYVKSYADIGGSTSLRQELSAAYFPYGVIYLTKVNAIEKYKAAYAGRILSYPIERWQNYEINDIWDFLCTETILKHLRKGVK